MQPRFFAAFAAALLFLAGPASALTVQGQNFGSDITAEVLLSWDGTDTLTITVENTSNAAAVTEAFITGFAFNLPDAVTGLSSFSASGTLDDAAWDWLDVNPSGGPGNAPGGYLFEAGAGSGNNIAGGTPNDGIGIGSTGTFVFVFTGALGGLTEDDFLNELTSGDAGDSNFGVRFQGIPTGAGSDFAVNVPEPVVAALLLAGLPLLLRRRR